MEKLSLSLMTKKLCHKYFQEFTNDSDICLNDSEFREFVYKKEVVDKYYEHQQQDNRKAFFIMKNNDPIGEVILKKIDYIKKECTLSIHLQNDTVKGQGIGTWAEKQIIDYAFNELNLGTVFADTVKKNVRSQNVLKKVGFEIINEDELFKYYFIKKKS
jgi:RimJ/RimL family protein N-acetyltransferase